MSRHSKVARGAALSQAIVSCSWLPATHPLYRLALSTLRSHFAQAGGGVRGLATILGVEPRTARRTLVAFGLLTARQERAIARAQGKAA